MTVAAITAVLGGRRTLKKKIESDFELTQLTREGLPVDVLTLLAQELSIDRKALAKVVGISDRTLNRRIASGSRLSAEESDRTVRPNMVLEGQRPVDLLDTDVGARSVETILGRIAWGVYS
jgi:uncharacterized protein (DUF2384 family)